MRRSRATHHKSNVYTTSSYRNATPLITELASIAFNTKNGHFHTLPAPNYFSPPNSLPKSPAAAQALNFLFFVVSWNSTQNPSSNPNVEILLNLKKTEIVPHENSCRLCVGPGVRSRLDRREREPQSASFLGGLVGEGSELGRHLAAALAAQASDCCVNGVSCWLHFVHPRHAHIFWYVTIA